MGIDEWRSLARRGDDGARELACALERVPGLSDAVLEAANRHAARRHVPLRSVDRAVVVLGARVVVEIALSMLPD
ncbi:MAG TPA: HDOD domain-containing protein [Myxococcota bacterium]|nr:HDOD domain-containing protein [Myxococcota bacterium]